MTLYIILAIIAVVVLFFIAAGLWDSKKIGAGVSTALLIVIVGVNFISFGTKTDVIIKIMEKERIAESDGGRWLIHTEDETFENTDAMLHGKYGSTDLQRKLQVERKYNCQVNGFRVRLTSSYRNILKCEEVQ